MTRYLIKLKTTVLALLVLVASCKADNQNNSSEDMNKEQIITLVKNNKVEAVRQVLADGAPVNTQDENLRSLLLLATIQRYEEMATLLVEYGANVNLQDKIHDSPFLYAGANGQTNLVRLFLEHGARFDVFNRYNGTALIPACERGHIATVELLANTKGFPIDHVNRLG